MRKNCKSAALIVAVLFGLFALPQAARADVVALAIVKPAVGNPGCVDGQGAFSVDPGRKFAKIEMVVVDSATNKEVSRSVGVVPKGTTQWGSISSKLDSPGAYIVYGEIFTTDMMDMDLKKTKGNAMIWNQ